MEVGVSLGSVTVHKHIGHPCSLRVHSADVSNVLKSNNAAVSAFRHVQWNKGLEADMSLRGGRGLDIRLCIKGYVKSCMVTVFSTLLPPLCSQRRVLNAATAVISKLSQPP